jgi:hypothetical protein
VGMVPPKKKVRASSGISPASSFQILDTKRWLAYYIVYVVLYLAFQNSKSASRNVQMSLTYLFHEISPMGTPGDDRDVHYHCLHGAHKVCTIKRLMQSKLNGAQPYFCLLLVFLSYCSSQFL